jgi:photosystem II stability/assembly factor-like uncharacterized protein
MRSWRPFFLAVLIVVACSDDAQQPVLPLAGQYSSNQPGWHWSNPHPQGNDLNDVDFIGSQIGYAVGNFGSIIRTMDGGITWELQNSGTTDFLFGVAASGWRGAVAVGANGTILSTVDRGATWERRQSGVTSVLNDVDFADANHGMVVGQDVILRTNDAGATWTPADLALFPRDDEFPIGFGSVCMVDANTAFVLGNARLYATSDGGATWVKRFAPRVGTAVFFTDANVGTIVGPHGTVLRTHDGGMTWSLLDAHIREDLNRVSFVDANHGLVAGTTFESLYSSFYTSDGGETWTSTQVIGPRGITLVNDFRGAALLDANTGVVVGAMGNILRTTDAGQTWENQERFPAVRLEDVSFANASDGIAVGVATILRTRDGGATWDRYYPGPTFLFGVSYVGATGVVAVGFDALSGGRILRSTDKGATWTAIPVDNLLRAVDFADGLTGSAAGDGGAILRTTDGGATWLLQASGTTQMLNDISLLNANGGIAVGDNGTLLRTTDGGTLWQSLPQPGVTIPLNGVDFADSEVGFVVGSRTILRTTDGGATWAPLDSGINGNFLDVACPDGKSAAVLATLPGDWTRVLVTTDGGSHWTPSEPIVARFEPWTLAISGKKTATVAGDFGDIFQNHHVFP